MASDMMLTRTDLNVEHDHPDSKIIPLSTHCALMYSGATLFATLIAESVLTRMGKQRENTEKYATCTKEALHELRIKRIQDVVLTPRGLEFDTLYKQDIKILPDSVVEIIENAIGYEDLVGVEMTVAGVEKKGDTACIYGINPQGEVLPADAGDYRSIGIGKNMADLSLMRAQQHSTLELGPTIFNVFTAKRDAELVVGVGRKTSMTIIHENGGCKQLSNNHLSHIAKQIEKADDSLSRTLDQANSELITSLGLH